MESPAFICADSRIEAKKIGAFCFVNHHVEIRNVESLLSALKSKKFQLAVATNKRIDYAKNLLDHFRLAPYFETIQGSDFENKKTKPDIISCAMRALHTGAIGTVMVGDTVGDLSGAHSNRISFLAVTYGFGFKGVSEAVEQGAIFAAYSPSDLQNYLLSGK